MAIGSEIVKVEPLPRPGLAALTVPFTAHGLDSDRHLTLAAGFDLHLAKPIRPRLLITAIARLLTIR